ncbi:hypothetical protein HDU76_010576 [Blyttiomyces sp. JEL0837]|nr:hypothetical protein HDU76_010576 [Blyttiomyces sp. JEL0837]
MSDNFNAKGNDANNKRKRQLAEGDDHHDTITNFHKSRSHDPTPSKRPNTTNLAPYEGITRGMQITDSPSGYHEPPSTLSHGEISNLDLPPSSLDDDDNNNMSTEPTATSSATATALTISKLITRTMKKGGKPTWDRLPTEILAETFKFLTPTDLYECALVSRRFTGPAMSALWRVIPLADLAHFATWSNPSATGNGTGTGTSQLTPTSSTPPTTNQLTIPSSPLVGGLRQRRNSRASSIGSVAPVASSFAVGDKPSHVRVGSVGRSGSLVWDSNKAITSPVLGIVAGGGGGAGDKNGETESLKNHARLVEIGPGVQHLVVTRYALPIQTNVLRVIAKACPRLDTLEIFHDATIFDPSEDDLRETLPESEVNAILLQKDNSHLQDSHVETLVSILGPKLKSISLEGVLGLTPKSIDHIRIHCTNLESLRIRFCLDESSSEALGKLIEAKPGLKSLGTVGLHTNLFGPVHLGLVSKLKKLKHLRVDTDGARSPFTPAEIATAFPSPVAVATSTSVVSTKSTTTMTTAPTQVFPELQFLSLSRTHGGFDPVIVVPILHRLDHLVELVLTCPFDPIVPALSACANTLRKLRVMTALQENDMPLLPSAMSYDDEDETNINTNIDATLFDFPPAPPTSVIKSSAAAAAALRSWNRAAAVQRKLLSRQKAPMGASDRGLIELAATCPNLVSFHLYVAPPQDLFDQGNGGIGIDNHHAAFNDPQGSIPVSPILRPGMGTPPGLAPNSGGGGSGNLTPPPAMNSLLPPPALGGLTPPSTSTNGHQVHHHHHHHHHHYAHGPGSHHQHHQENGTEQNGDHTRHVHHHHHHFHQGPPPIFSHINNHNGARAIAITDTGILALAAGCRNLEVLSVRAGHPLWMPGVTDASIRGLMEMESEVTELRLEPGMIRLKTIDVGGDSSASINGVFKKLAVAQLGSLEEGVAKREDMEAFVRDRCPKLASFRYIDGECAREFMRAEEPESCWWMGWEEDMFLDEDEDEELDEEDEDDEGMDEDGFDNDDDEGIEEQDGENGFIGVGGQQVSDGSAAGRERSSVVGVL